MQKLKNLFTKITSKAQNKKLIQFIPQSKDVDVIVEEPKPAKHFLPEWYKKMEIKIGGSKHVIATNGQDNKSVKSCIPVFDAMTSGYVITLPCDVFAVLDTETEKYTHRLFWHTDWQVVTQHNRTQYPGMPIPENYEKDAYKWENGWTIKTPPGYSCWITHPINRFDLPFYTFTGFVDTDAYKLPINLPFLLDKKFEGIIKKGTPIAQIIPIKRDGWIGVRETFSEDSFYMMNDLKSVINRSYASRWWNKKRYD